MESKNIIYKEIVKRVRYSKRNFIELENTKDELREKITDSFINCAEFNELKFIGSCATGSCVKWKKDIDGVVILDPFSSREFRSSIERVEGLEGIVFADKCRIVGDKFDARYKGYEVSIGCVDGKLSPYEDLGADLTKHPNFVAERLTAEKIDEVLLTKIFLKNVGLYGGKVGGFASEQIIAHFGNFDNFIEQLVTGKPIFIDFSDKYSGPYSSLVISYPYCGLGNLTNVSEQEFQMVVKYARVISKDPGLFLEDSCSTINRLFWEKRAILLSDKEELSMPDIHLSRKENRILRRIIFSEGSKLNILDVGCANGYSTIAINLGSGNRVIGIDNNMKLISSARRMTAEQGLENFEFLVSDMSKLPFGDSSFNLIYAKRSLSNLPSQQKQEKAIQEIHRILKRRGLFLLSDLLEEGYDNINRIRSKVGLEEVNLPYHGNLLKEKEILRLVARDFTTEDKDDFSSTYYFLSRIVYPRLLEFIGGYVMSDSRANKLFSKLPSIGRIGVNKLYILRKNGD